MTNPSKPPRLVLLRASRETVVLIAVTTAMAFAVSLAVHRRPAQEPVAAATTTPAEKGWAGQLAGVALDTGSTVPVEPLTSASLVVEPPPPAPVAASAPVVPSNAAVAPGTPARAPAKARGCDQPTCPTAPVAGPTGKAGTTQVASIMVSKPAAPTEAAMPTREKDVGFMSRLNPLKHLPESVRHPIDTAGNAVSGWIKRL